MNYTNGNYKEDIIRLIKEGKSYKEISILLGCAKSTISHHAKSVGIQSKHMPKSPTSEEVKSMIEDYKRGMTIKELSKKYRYAITTISSRIPSHLKPTSRIKTCLTNSEKIAKHRKKVKQMAVELKGGACCLCGYSSCIGALHFHHVDPESKRFTLSLNGMTRSWSSVQEELKKCILVCANCHSEIHAGMHDEKDLNILK